MDDSKVEAAAKAMFERQRQKLTVPLEWHQLSPRTRDSYCDDARVALNAFRSWAETQVRELSKYRQFRCKCGRDWVTVLPDVDTCQVCYHLGTPDIKDWIVK